MKNYKEGIVRKLRSSIGEIRECMRNSFGLFPKPLVGLEITPSHLKLMAIQHTGVDLEILDCRLQALPPGLIVNQEIKDVEFLGEKIKALVAVAPLCSDWVTICLYGSAVITRTVSVPAGLSLASLEEEIWLAAEKYLPFETQEVSLDYQIFDRTTDASDTCDVLLAATRSDYIEQRLKALRLANLKAKVVEVERFAKERAFSLLAKQLPHSGVGQVVALVDIGVDALSLQVFDDLKPFFYQEQRSGDNRLTEIFALWHLFFSTHENRQVDCLILCGEVGNLQGLDKKIQEKLQLKTLVADVFANVNIGKQVDLAVIRKHGTGFLACAGLALRQNC